MEAFSPAKACLPPCYERRYAKESARNGKEKHDASLRNPYSLSEDKWLPDLSSRELRKRPATGYNSTRGRSKLG
jgi:hypothetical protein